MQQGNATAILFTWIFFFAALFVFAFVLIRLLHKSRKRKVRQAARLADFKDKYAHLTPALIDECEDENLPGAIVLECQQKEDEDENYFDHLNEVEKTVYGIYNINQCLTSSIGLRSFFMTPAMAPYVDAIDDIFTNVKAPEFIELLNAAKRLNEVMEGMRADEEDGEYAKYNFSDFTAAYKSMIAGTNFEKKVISYIRENKELFKGEEDETTR